MHFHICSHTNIDSKCHAIPDIDDLEVNISRKSFPLISLYLLTDQLKVVVG